MDQPITDSEREIVLALLTQRAINAEGIALACADLRPSFIVRGQLVLDTLLAEGRVVHPYPEVWKLAKTNT
jgi:hypothetical protein